MRSFVIVLLCALYSAWAIIITDMDQIPTLVSSDSVQFFLLEAPFPYNVPDEVRTVFGAVWNDYSISHAGLGIWDTTTDKRFSIEFISDSYIGALFPILDNATSSIRWNNSASIVVTDPTVDDNWVSANLISDTTGAAYNNLVTYLQDNSYLYTVYQPVAVILTNESNLVNASVTDIESTSDIGITTVAAQNSFWFVTEMLSQLWIYGSDLDEFIQTYATSFIYLQSHRGMLGDGKYTPIVHLDNQEMQIVYEWYLQLQVCYTKYFDEAAKTPSDNNADMYLTNIRHCYGQVAYVYLSSTEVYNISLFQAGNDTDVSPSATTPVYTQYVYAFPENMSAHRELLTVFDAVLIGLIIIASFIGVGFVMHKLLGTQELDQSEEQGSKVATRLVENTTEGEQLDYYESRESSIGIRRSIRNSLASVFFRGSSTVTAPATATVKTPIAHNTARSPALSFASSISEDDPAVIRSITEISEVSTLSTRYTQDESEELSAEYIAPKEVVEAVEQDDGDIHV